MKSIILINGARFYENNNDGHGLEHIQEVMANLTKLMIMAEKDLGIKLNKELMYTAALYHDTGSSIDRKTHHLESAKIVKSEEYLKEIFSEDEINMIALMCEEHRSSRKEPCTNILSALLNDADSMTTFDKMIERCYKYNLKHNEDKSYEAVFDEVYKHLVEKFGRNGYQQFRTKYANSLMNVEERYEVLDNKELFKIKYNKIIKR